MISINADGMSELQQALQAVLGWGSPIGLGIFLLCLAVAFLAVTKAGAIDKQTKQLANDKDSERTKDK